MIIPGFTSTGSKRPEALFGSPTAGPARMVRAEGCRVWDEHGREYLDTVMALGAVALGYGHPAVVAAAEQAARDGAVGPLAPVLEVRVAERLAQVLPGVEGVRFFKTGAEAMAGAVRAARVVTGHDRVITCGYHGWLDWCQDTPGVPHAVRDQRTAVSFNDREALAAATAAGPAAAIVIEPLVDEAPDPDWLRDARQLATRLGAVLVFDEIKTAFRIARGGVAERTGVVPDLLVVGKALGNGFPLAALGGVRDVMAGCTRTWMSSTLATEFVSLAAAEAVMEVFDRDDVVGHLERTGGLLLRGLRALAVRYPALIRAVRGVPQMCYLQFVDSEASARVARAAAARGVLFKRTAYNFVSLAHNNAAVQAVLDRLDEALGEVAATC